MRLSGLRVALAISVILNLFALGAVGGALAVWSHVGRHPAAVRGRPLMTAADALPPADGAHYRALMQATLLQNRPLMRTARENRSTAASLFVQPSFDTAAAGAALARARDADFQLRTRFETAVIDFAKDLPQTERAALVQGLARGGPLRHPPARPSRGPSDGTAPANPGALTGQH